MRNRLCLGLFIVFCFLWSCKTPDPQGETAYEDPGHAFMMQIPVQGEKLVDAKSVEGRPLVYSVFGSGEKTVLFIGGIHGNEPASVVLCEALMAFLKKNSSAFPSSRVVVAPAVNPDGLLKNHRWNANGVDLNRNFRTSNRRNSNRFGKRPLCEPESRFIESLIRRMAPSIVVSIHQPIYCIDWDGPAIELAKKMSRLSGVPLRKLGSLPGSLGSYVGNDLGIPIITLELSRKDTRKSGSDLWKSYGKALLAVLNR